MNSPTSLPPSLKARVLADISKTPAAPPGTYTKRLVLAVAVLFGWLALVLIWKGLRKDVSELPSMYLIGSVVTSATAGGLLTYLGLTRGRAMLGAPPLLQIAGTLLVPMALGAWAMMVVGSGAHSLVPVTAANAFQTGLHCDAFAMVFGVPILLGLLSVKRGMETSVPRFVGACLGAAAGAWAHLGMHLICPVSHTLHALVGHVLPAIPLALVGAVFGHYAFQSKKS
jgi:hypothetical protein